MLIQGGKYGTLAQQQTAAGDKSFGTVGASYAPTYKGNAPIVPTTSPTVISDTNVRDNVIPDIQAKAGQMLGTDQNPLYLRPGETPEAYKARVAGIQGQGGTTGTDSTQDTSTDPTDSGSEYDALYKSILGQTPQQDNFYDSDLALLQSMQKTSDAKTSNALAGISSQFQQQRNDLAAQQQAGAQSANALLNRGGGNRSGSGSMLISAQGRGYIREASNIDLQEQQATSEALSAQADNDYKLLGEKLDVLKDKRQEKLDVVNKLYDTMVAEKTETQKNISATVESAAQGGAPKDVLDAIGAATDTNSAIAAAGPYLQQGSGQIGDYIQYKKDAMQQGLAPQDYATWKAADDARQAKVDSSAAYSKAYASAAGAAAAANDLGTGDTGTAGTPDPNATGITGATGLSLQAFNYLTQGTASMSRMPAAQRNQIMAEANDYLNKNGLDVSTFQSQFKAYNDVLQKNIERENNTQIFGGEVAGTTDQFIADAGTDFGKLKVGNVAKLLAGEQVNDPTVQKYAFNLQTMQNDLAGYYAASRGASSPDDADLKAAAGVITNGLNAGTAQAFKDSITSNQAKVKGVVSTAVNSAQKQVWDLFGVGAQYQPKSEQVDPKDAVDSYVSTNPDKGATISQLYAVPGATDQDVWDYINKVYTPQ